MVANAQRREDLDVNQNQNQGNRSGTGDITQETKGVIIDFLEAKRRLSKRKLSNKRELDKDVFEHIKENEKLITNIYEAFLWDNINLESLENLEIKSKTIESMLNSNIIDNNFKKYVINRLLGPLREKNEYDEIFSLFIEHITFVNTFEKNNTTFKNYITTFEENLTKDGISPECKKNFIKDLKENLEEIKLSYGDIIKLKSSDKNFHKIEDGVKARFLAKEDDFKEFKKLLSPIIFHQLDKEGNITNTALNNISWKNIMEKNSLDMFYYFYSEYNKFIIDEEGNFDEKNFNDKFYEYLENTNRQKASIFHKIFIENDDAKKVLSKVEQDNIIDDIKPRLLEYLLKKHEDKDSDETIKKFVENFQVPDSILQIWDSEEKINVTLGISSGTWDNKENQHQHFLDDCKLNLKIEILKSDFDKYPLSLEDRVIFNIGERNIKLDEEEDVNWEISIYRNQFITVELNDGTTIDWYLKLTDDNKLVLNEDNEVNLDDIVSIKTWNVQRKLSEIETDISKHLKDEDEDVNNLTIAERVKILRNVWEDDIDGKGEFEVWAVLHFALWNNEALEWEDFWQVYTKCTIESINENTGEMSLNFSITDSGENVSRVFEIEKACKSREENLFTMLKATFWWEFFTMGQWIWSKSDFITYLKNNKKIEWPKDLPIPGELREYAKKDKFGEISYIWRVGRTNIKVKKDWKMVDKEVDSPLFFKPTFEKNKVRLVATGWWYDQYMSYDEFLVFVSNKQLKPYTSEEKKETTKEIEQKKDSRWTFYSLENVLHLFKMPADELKTKWKRRDERLWTELYGNIIGSDVAKAAFGWIPYMDEVSQEAKAQASHKIKQLIWEYEKHYEENFSHDAIAANAIEEEILHNEATALKAHKKFHYKALAAYKFASKRDHPYFRGLKDKAGSGLWVLAILWPNLYEQFKKEYANKKKEVLDNPGKIDLINELTQLEMTFIKGEIDGTWLYPGWTGPGLEWVRDVVAGKGAVQDWFDDMEKKSNYTTKNSSKESLVWNHRLGKLVGAQKWVAKAVYNNMDYRNQYKDLLFYSLSGLLNIWSAKPQKLDFEQTVHAIWFTPGYYMMDDGIKWGEKLVNLLDLITRKLMNGVSFQDEVKYDFKKLHFWEGYHKENIKFQKRMEEFWKKHGVELMDILSLKNLWKDKDLFSLLWSIDGEEKKLVEDYLYKKSIDGSKNYGEDFVNESNGLNNENIYWSENVMNYPKWVSSKLFSTTQNWLFKDCEWKDITETLWNNIKKQFDSLSLKAGNMTTKEKNNIRKWGVDKVLQFLEWGSWIPTDVATIIKARSYPKGEGKREKEFEKIKGRELDLKSGKTTLNNLNDLNNFDLTKAIGTSVYEEKWKYPEALSSWIKSLLNFLEALR